MLVTGGRVSGRAVIPALLDLGASVTVADSSNDELALCAELGAQTSSMDEAERDVAAGVFALVVTSPGFRPDAPVLVAATTVGIEVWGDIEFSWRVDRAEIYGPARTWLVITGTNGKTTTTSMVESILRASGVPSAACGNIGVPVLDALRRTDPAPRVLAVELSSVQLFWAPSVRPDAGVVLNIAEDHLDWHGSMGAYVDAKSRALTGQVAVVGLDDPIARTLLGDAAAPTKIGYTAGEPAVGQLGVRDGSLVDVATGDPEILIAADEIEPAGPAGLQDALAAAALTRSIGTSAAAVADGLRAFRVGPHRAALVREIGGVRFVDDSKATNPHAARSSILAHDRVIWLAGGLLKGAVVDDMVAEVRSRLAAAVVFGRDGAEIAAALARHAPDVPVVRIPPGDDSSVAHVTDGDEVMKMVVQAAASRAVPGTTVLLAPSTASFDQFRDYGHRGDSFAAAASALSTSDLGLLS